MDNKLIQSLLIIIFLFVAYYLLDKQIPGASKAVAKVVCIITAAILLFWMLGVSVGI